MTGLFLWSNVFPSGPSTLPASELLAPNAGFVDALCTINGYLTNQGTCYGFPTTNVAAYRVMFNVSALGRTGLAGVYGLGAPFYDCAYDPGLTNSANLNSVIERFPVGSVVRCYVDNLWTISYGALAPVQTLRTKDFALLDFSRAVIDSWDSTETYRSVGLYLGYVWVPLTFMMIYGGCMCICSSR
jgi:hypothetical protein